MALSILEKLKEYFNTHTEEEIQKDWEQTSKYDKINSPTVIDWLNKQKQ